jgi:hypothetical protein
MVDGNKVSSKTANHFQKLQARRWLSGTRPGDILCSIARSSLFFSFPLLGNAEAVNRTGRTELQIDREE